MNTSTEEQARLVASHTKTLAALEEQMQSLLEYREAVAEAERKLKLREATLLITIPPEGKNAEERAARHLVYCETDPACAEYRMAIQDNRRGAGEFQIQVDITREECRMLRLQLALLANPGVVELAS